MRRLPLQGVTIIDLTRLYPGPLATLILSDMGADVIKIESPEGNGDLMRGNGPNFQALNRGKKSIALNLSRKEDKRHLHHLISKSDVVIESFRPGVFEKLLDVKNTKELSELYPKLIIARISAFGQNEGKLKLIPAHDMNSLAYAGVFELSSDQHKPLPIQAVDLLTGYSTAAQIIAAIHLRSSDKKGSFIDISMYDVAASTSILALSQHFSTRKPISHGKDELTGRPCYTIYKTKEGFLSIGCLEPHFWKKFVIDLGLEKLSGMQHAFAVGSEGKRVQAMVEEKLLTKTAQEWQDFFTSPSRLLPIVRLRSPEELYKDTLLGERKMYTTVRRDDDTFEVLKPALDYVNFLQNHRNEFAPNLGQDQALIQSKL